MYMPICPPKRLCVPCPVGCFTNNFSSLLSFKTNWMNAVVCIYHSNLPWHVWKDVMLRSLAMDAPAASGPCSDIGGSEQTVSTPLPKSLVVVSNVRHGWTSIRSCTHCWRTQRWWPHILLLLWRQQTSHDEIIASAEGRNMPWRRCWKSGKEACLCQRSLMYL